MRWRAYRTGPGNTRAREASAVTGPYVWIRSGATGNEYKFHLSKALKVGAPAKIHRGGVTEPILGGLWSPEMNISGSGPFKGSGTTPQNELYPPLSDSSEPVYGGDDIAEVYAYEFDECIKYGDDLIPLIIADKKEQIAGNARALGIATTRTDTWSVKLTDGYWLGLWRVGMNTFDTGFPDSYLYNYDYMTAEALDDPAIWNALRIQGIIERHGYWPNYGQASRKYEAGVSGFVPYGMPRFYLVDTGHGARWATPSVNDWRPGFSIGFQDSVAWPEIQSSAADMSEWLVEDDGGGGSGWIQYRQRGWAFHG